jgi:hypothetical protein
MPEGVLNILWFSQEWLDCLARERRIRLSTVWTTVLIYFSNQYIRENNPTDKNAPKPKIYFLPEMAVFWTFLEWCKRCYKCFSPEHTPH